MNKGLAHVLINRIGRISFIDLYAGIVSVQEKKDVEVDDLGKVIKSTINRFPVSADFIDYSNDSAEVMELVSLIPDSKRNGILYFEDNGIRYNGSSGTFSNYRSSLRLVCWLNTKFIEKNEYHELGLPVMNEIITRLKGRRFFFNQDGYLKVFLTIGNIPKHGKELFAAYTYDENVTQFLMPPYESFAIDLQVDFSVSNNCTNNVMLKVGEIC